MNSKRPTIGVEPIIVNKTRLSNLLIISCTLPKCLNFTMNSVYSKILKWMNIIFKLLYSPIFETLRKSRLNLVTRATKTKINSLHQTRIEPATRQIPYSLLKLKFLQQLVHVWKFSLIPSQRSELANKKPTRYCTIDSICKWFCKSL